MATEQMHRLIKEISLTALNNGIFDLSIWSQVIWLRGYIAALPFPINETEFSILNKNVIIKNQIK